MAAGKRPGWGRVVVFGAAIVAVIVMWVVSANSDDGPPAELPTARGVERSVTSADVSPWPFTVDSGVLRCQPASGAVTFQPGGKGDRYALNGAAKTIGYPGVETYWALDPQAPAGSGLRVGLTAAIDAGAALC
ncbi:hypothetical protein [Kitasatospora sp. NPDC004272]